MPRRLELTVAMVLVLLPPLVGSAIVCDASRRRARARDTAPRIERVARAMPFPGLAIGRGARWARFPAAVEPGAASQDSPGLHDPDAAGLAVRPPIELWIRSER